MVNRRSKGEIWLNDCEQVIIFRVNSVYNEERKGAFESTESLWFPNMPPLAPSPAAYLLAPGRLHDEP